MRGPLLHGPELCSLSAWCRRHHLSWSAAASADHAPAVTLLPRDAGRPWQRMRLVLHAAELRLENEQGETLASASDLPALLDAVDGGVAEPPAPPRAGSPPSGRLTVV